MIFDNDYDVLIWPDGTWLFRYEYDGDAYEEGSCRVLYHDDDGYFDFIGSDGLDGGVYGEEDVLP
ncbi:hypothetical protein ACSAK4_000916 [Salmonella enterica subsp. enterica serovar Newport]